MLDLSHGRVPSKAVPGLMNWEYDIQSISIVACGIDVDPSGFVVQFHRVSDAFSGEQEEAYEVGASFLLKRLQQLKRAGFQAPMTKHAIEILRSKYALFNHNRIAA